MNLREVMRHVQIPLGLTITAVVVLIAVLGPLFAPHTPQEFVAAPFASSSMQPPLGADALGRDVLSRVLWGGRSVLWMSFAASVLGVGAGVAIGLFAGYSNSRASEVTMRSLDLVLAFPQLVLVLLFVSLLGASPWLVVGLTALAWMPGSARVVRGIVVEESQREYVQASRVVGLPRRQILFTEILPNLTTPILVEFALRMTWSIGLIAGLSFLGAGVQPPNADWGLMISENRNGLVVQPWATVVPVILIAVFTIGTNLIADGVARTIAGVDRLGAGS
jgi:peptide/nickel transport system permease protein